MLILCFTHLGNYLSVDRYLFKKPTSLNSTITYSFPIASGQFLLSWVLFSGFIAKLIFFSGSIWFTSDNFRNILLIQSLVSGQASLIREIIANHIYLYKPMAFINILLQGSIILGCFFFKKPKIRAFFGILFILECLGLFIVMGLMPFPFSFNMSWILLASFFIDWDHFFKKKKTSTSPLTVKNKIALTVLSGLICINCILSILGKERPYFYPISRTTMYSSAHSKKPYNTHQTYEYLAKTWKFNNKLIQSPDHNLSRKLYSKTMWYDFQTPKKIEMLLKEKYNTISNKEILSVHQSLLSFPKYPNKEKYNILFTEKIASISENKKVSQFFSTYDKTTHTLYFQPKNMPKDYKVVCIKRKIEYDYKTILGKKRCIVIKTISSPTPLKTKEINKNHFQILEDFENVLISFKIINPLNNTYEVFAGPLIKKL